jgi:hypothetical protein
MDAGFFLCSDCDTIVGVPIQEDIEHENTFHRTYTESEYNED